MGGGGGKEKQKTNISWWPTLSLGKFYIDSVISCSILMVMKGGDALEWSVEVGDKLYKGSQEWQFPIPSKKWFMIYLVLSNMMGQNVHLIPRVEIWKEGAQADKPTYRNESWEQKLNMDFKITVKEMSGISRKGTRLF